MTKRQKFFSALGQFFKDLFTKNILLKVAALVFALLLWGYVLSEEKPKYTKRVSDVKIELVNENRLQEKEWEVVEIDPPMVDVSIEAGIDMHSMLDSSRVKCYVDLSRVTITDQDADQKTVELSIVTTIPEYGVLKGVSVEHAEVTIERIKSSEALAATVRTEGSLPAVVKTNDPLPEGFECICPKQVTVQPVSGLKSEIDRISSAEVTVDLSAFDDDTLDKIPGTYSLIRPVVFRDAEGNVIDSSVTQDVTVIVSGIEIRRYKDVPIELTVSDETFNKDLYEYECGIAEGVPDTVRIYGDAAELANVRSIQTETIVPNPEAGKETLTVGLIIPDDIKVKNDQKTVPVVLTVEKRTENDVEFDVPVQYSATDEGIVLKEKTETIRIKVSGLVEAMNAFDPSWLTASVDLHRCGEGKQKLPFTLQCKGTNLHLQNYVVRDAEDGSEPVILITYVSAKGMTYQIELQENTVNVVLNAVNIDTAG